MARMAKLTFEGHELDLPVTEGSEGELGVAIGQLRAKTGLITLDQGFSSTGACESSITYIDGDKGILRYRGIPIEQLAEKSNFIETSQLLICGKLPTESEDKHFRSRLTANAMLHESFRRIIAEFPADSPPMAVLSAMLSALAGTEQKFLKIENDDEFYEASAVLISKVRTIAAYCYRVANGLPMLYPDPKLKYVENFLHLLFSEPYQQYQADPDIVSALDQILLLHADHEQNCSTSTVRMVGSSRANIFASLAAGVGALWGPLHGGANVAVLEMLDAIHKGRVTPEEYLRLSKEKGSGVRLMGFGHRVYKNFDPRAQILKKACDKVFAKLKVADPLLDIARKLEELALKDSYFVERKLYPNVDFYSGIIMKAIGIPVNMFTVMFAIGRMPGWIAQWKEQAKEGEARIARPRQIYTGPTRTDFTPMNQRPASPSSSSAPSSLSASTTA